MEKQNIPIKIMPKKHLKSNINNNIYIFRF